MHDDCIFIVFQLTMSPSLVNVAILLGFGIGKLCVLFDEKVVTKWLVLLSSVRGRQKIMHGMTYRFSKWVRSNPMQVFR